MDLDTSIQAISLSIANLQQTFADIQTKLSRTVEEKEALDAQYEALRTERIGLENEVLSITQVIVALKPIQEMNISLTKAVEDTKASIAMVKSQIGQATAETTSLQNLVKVKQAELATALNTNEQKVVAFNELMSQLERE